jgi:hypothetical protein
MGFYQRSEVFMAVKMWIVVFWIEVFFYPDDGGNVFLRNVGNHPQNYTVLKPRKR